MTLQSFMRNKQRHVRCATSRLSRNGILLQPAIPIQTKLFSDIKNNYGSVVSAGSLGLLTLYQLAV